MYSKSEIAQAELLGSGANRYCVISPRDKSICLKIDLPASQRQVKNWRQALQRFLSQHVTRFNENYIEWIAYQKLKQRINEAELVRFIAPCLELKNNNDKQQILSCQLIRNADGSIAQSLDHHLKNGIILDLSKLNQAIDELKDWLLKNNIPLFDLNSGNLVVQYDADKIRLICIDIKSTYKSKEIIPISYWSKKMMHKKIQRRAERLKNIVQHRQKMMETV